MLQTTPSRITLFLPRLNAVLFILLFLSALTLGPRMLNIDGDLPRHLLMGKIVLETGTPPTEEIFSYVYENQPYNPHEWLAGVLYYLAYIFLGLNGVVLLASLLIATTFALLYSEAVSRNASLLLTFLLLFLGATVTSIHWITRPHLFTMLFLAIWIILIERQYQGMNGRVWNFPLIMLFWANIHAEFIAGFLVLLAYIAGCFWQFLFNRSDTVLQTARTLMSITFISFLASMVNPVGLRTWDIVVGYINNRYLLSRIAETRPPDFFLPEYWPLLALLGIAALVLIARRKNFLPAHFFLLAGFGLMSLLSARNAHLTGVVFPFVLSIELMGIIAFRPLKNIEALIRRMEAQANKSMWPVIITVLISVLILSGPVGKLNRFEPSVFPVEAVRWLEAHPQQGRMFNAFDWGGYILFHLWPEQKVFIESQTDVTGEATRQYEAVITLQEGWQDIFNQYEITWVIIPPEWALTKELETQGWKMLYQDQTAAILAQK